MYRFVDNLFSKFYSVVTIIAKILLVGMTLIASVQVFTRYILGKSIRWSEEVPLILMVWFGFISMAIGVRDKLHLSIEVFYNLFSKKWRLVIYRFSVFVVMCFGLVMVFAGSELAIRTMSSTLPATKLPSGYLYAVIPISGIMITYDSVVELITVSKFKEEVREGNKCLT